jgi:hypothetical protein
MDMANFPIDFTPYANKEKKLIEIGRDLSIDDLRNATNVSVDYLLSVLDGLTDADVVFDPVDPDAHDPEAVDGEETIGWSIAHLLAHVTASSEEGAAFSSLLARGIEVTERPRYETPWRDITTVEQCRQRLEESRRMRLAYLDTWPDTPFLDVYRVPKTERFHEYFGDLNATASFLMGLGHEVGHYAQIEGVKQQALAARK